MDSGEIFEKIEISGTFLKKGLAFLNFLVIEKCKFSPSLGSFPDVGTSYFMHQILNADQKFENLARYLALTGDIISSFDCQKINVGTHFIWSKNLETVKNLILENPEKLDQILADFAVETWAESSRLDEIREDIKLGFAGNSVAEIFENLGNLESEFAQKTLQKLKKLSPTSLEVTFEQIKLGKNPDHTLRDALNLEYSLGCQFMDEPNFFEGVRAILVDKTFDPKWSAKPENVSRYFTDKKYQWLSVEW